MKPSEVHKMKDQELVETITNFRKQLFNLRGQAVTEKLENPRQFGNLKRDIARMLTEQREREMQRQPQEFA